MIYEQPELKIDKEAQKKPKKFHKATTEAFSSGACCTDKFVNKLEEDITSNSKRGNL